MKKKALFSLYNTEKVERFAADLVQAGWEIIASKETVEILSRKRLPVVDIADFTGVKENYGFPPTLHPKVELFLTSSDDNEKRIDLVYVINYPLSEGNDVGGRTLLALAAKGKRIPITSVSDMELVIDKIKANGKISDELHSKLLDKTNALISSHYDDLISEKIPYDTVFGTFKYGLKNGENPYQSPASLFAAKGNDPLSLSNFKQLSGEPPCFTNLADSDCIIQTISLASEAFRLKYGKTPYICIAAKHGNPCGMAIDWDSPYVAVNKALFGNPRAIWGGEVITNFTIDQKIAELLFKSNERERSIGSSSWMLDVILAPEFTREAVDILGINKIRKLFENKALYSPFLIKAKWTYRFVRGGFLRQPPNNYVLNLEEAKFIGTELNNDMDSLIIAWVAAFSSNHGGNEVALAKKSALISCGGAPSTVEAVQHTVFKAEYLGHDIGDSVFAADAFFPFIDAPELLVKAGITAGLVPSGGKAIEKVMLFFKENNVNMFYIPEVFRGFCRH